MLASTASDDRARGETPSAAAAEQLAPSERASGFQLSQAWRLHPLVALRPERFGALAYHFGTRRLSFLKSATLLGVLERLDGVRSAREACALAGVDESELPRYTAALATLADSGMLVDGKPS